MMAEIRFDEETVPAIVGDSLLEHAERTRGAYKQVATSCDGMGTCGECVVSVVAGAGALNEATAEEAAIAGLEDDVHGGFFRLACQACVIDDSQDIEVATFQRSLKILTDTAAEHDRRLAPRVRREGDLVVIGDTTIERPGGGLYGVALDAGTTSVVAQLVDLTTGETRHTVAFENPQRFGGSNVVNRIAYDRDHRGLLQRVLVAHLNSALDEMPCRNDEIYEVVVAGNPTMRDLLFGLDVQPLGFSPFLSVTETDQRAGTRKSTALDCRADRLGLAVNPTARVYGLPLVACHVGADAAAGIVVSDMWTSEEPVLFMDIGTNTEILLGNRHRILAASSPAGPAFEGAGVSFGMPGMTGAIDSVRFDQESLRWSTIGDATPRGICGSGLVDLLGELVRTGKINATGRFVDGTRVLPVAPEHGITFGERDIAEIAQAKGSNFAAQMILMKLFGIGPEDIGTLYLAGGFAEYLDVAQASRIGMIVPVPEGRVVKLGNASLRGARALLCDEGLRRELEEFTPQIEHVRLELDPDFFNLYVGGMGFQVEARAHP
jgi:uncharacterized 2Fe-2S/4Fe-4S cluster protein (DUF4445 family)